MTRAALSPSARARREQIVSAMIEVVAREGYAAASYARIAKHAGLSSTRLISYHFADKDDLVATTVATIVERIGAEVAAALAAADPTDPRARLTAYIRGVVDLHVTHRDAMQALAGIVLDHRAAGDARPYSQDDDRTAVGQVEALLRDGQSRGSFRAFDPFVLATAIQRSLDGLAFLLGTVPDLDLRHYADELVTASDLATRR